MTVMMSLPLGFLFDPSDEVLINSYLLKRVQGLPMPCCMIADRYLYGEKASPSYVLGDVDDYSSYYWQPEYHDANEVTKKTIFAFTKLVKTGPKSRRIARRAGAGTWKGQTKAVMIKNRKGEIIGSKKMLVYDYCADSSVDQEYHWIMHEYSLDGVYKNVANNDNVVLCKITRCSSKTTNDNSIPRMLNNNNSGQQQQQQKRRALEEDEEYEPKKKMQRISINSSSMEAALLLCDDERENINRDELITKGDEIPQLIAALENDLMNDDEISNLMSNEELDDMIRELMMDNDADTHQINGDDDQQQIMDITPYGIDHYVTLMGETIKQYDYTDIGINPEQEDIDEFAAILEGQLLEFPTE